MITVDEDELYKVGLACVKKKHFDVTDQTEMAALLRLVQIMVTPEGKDHLPVTMFIDIGLGSLVLSDAPRDHLIRTLESALKRLAAH